MCRDIADGPGSDDVQDAVFDSVAEPVVVLATPIRRPGISRGRS